MRRLLALALAILTLVAAIPQPTAAQEAMRFESPEYGLAFEYPAQWRLARAERRGVLRNELFSVHAGESPTTGFALGVYQLDTQVDHQNLETVLERVDQQVQAWVTGLPGANVREIYDIVVDTAEGREYTFDFQHEGQTVHADMIVALSGDKAVEITQWAKQAEYDARLGTFDQIFASLVLPWSPR